MGVPHYPEDNKNVLAENVLGLCCVLGELAAVASERWDALKALEAKASSYKQIPMQFPAW